MKKTIVILVCALLMLALTSCTAPTVGSENTFDPQYLSFVGSGAIYIFTDPETHIQYFLIDRGTGGGTAICPRYNADGTFYTGE